MLQRQSSFSAFADDVQYSFGISHPEYLPVVFRRNHLPPFAMWTARYAHDGGYTVIARPVVWKGKLAKVVVIAVPDPDRAVLNPQVIASDVPGRRRHPVAAGPW